MGLKTWLYDTLTTDTELIAAFAKQAYPLESLTSANVESFPYLMFGLGLDTAENLAEEDDNASRQMVRIWVHDERTSKSVSWIRVNDGIALLKSKLKNSRSAPDGLILLRYVNTSEELSDEATKTVYRYIDFEAVMGEQQ
jgi:hypothetical protein